MQGIAGLSLIMALAHLLDHSLAIPTLQHGISSLVSRSQYCFNAPGTKAGTFLGRRAGDGGAPTSAPSRSGACPIIHGNSPDELIVWCRQLSRTYVSATWEYPLDGISWSTAQSVLAIAIAMVHQQALAGGDGAVAKGAFQYGISDAQVYAANSNNHQVTLGVLGAALQALSDYFTCLQNSYKIPAGMVQFTVVDGDNEVARGFFGRENPPSADPPSGS